MAIKHEKASDYCGTVIRDYKHFNSVDKVMVLTKREADSPVGESEIHRCCIVTVDRDTDVIKKIYHQSGRFHCWWAQDNYCNFSRLWNIPHFQARFIKSDAAQFIAESLERWSDFVAKCRAVPLQEQRAIARAAKETKRKRDELFKRWDIDPAQYPKNY